MKDAIKKIPSWVGMVATIMGMVVFSSLTLGGDSRQIEINTKDFKQLELENKSDHRIMIDDINQLKIDVAIISEWVKDQKK